MPGLPPITDTEWETWQETRGPARQTSSLRDLLLANPPDFSAAPQPSPVRSSPAPAVAGPSASPAPPDLASGGVNQFGDPELSFAEASAACGPAAAIAFYQRTGRQMTVREATETARQNGLWDAENGMHGPESQQKLLSLLGVPTRLEQGVNWESVQRDVAGGNPVILDSPGGKGLPGEGGHYWQVLGYRPEDGRYFVSASGTAYRGGSEWMTPEEMAKLAGAPRSALYLDNPLTPTPSHAVTGPIDKSSPDAFIRSVTPYAVQVQAETGIPARIMIGIAANETGYGKSAPGNNFFGIKGANPDTGASFNSPTWEVENGRRVDTTAQFRQYDNPADSFRDFARFLSENPRYAGALQQASDPAAFIKAVHAAGYATDPSWSDKVLSIAGKVPNTPTPTPNLLALTQQSGEQAASVAPMPRPQRSTIPTYTPPTPTPIVPPTPPELGPSTLDQPAQPTPLSQRTLAGGAVETTYPAMISVVPGATPPSPTPPTPAPSLPERIGGFVGAVAGNLGNAAHLLPGVGPVVRNLEQGSQQLRDITPASIAVRNLAGEEQIAAESGPEWQALQTTLGQYGPDHPASQVAADAYNARTGALRTEGVYNVAERNPSLVPAELATNVAAGTVAGWVAPGAQAGVARNVLGAALDPGTVGMNLAADVARAGQAVGRTAAPVADDLSRAAQGAEQAATQARATGDTAAELAAHREAAAIRQMQPPEPLTPVGERYPGMEAPTAPEPAPVAPRATEMGVPPQPVSNLASGTVGALTAGQTGEDQEERNPQEQGLRMAAGFGLGLLGRRVASTVGRTAAREGFAGNVRLAKYPEEVRQIIQNAADANPAMMETARRGVLSDQVVQDLSRYSGIDVERIVRTWKPGQTQNAETLLALREALASQAQAVIRAQQAYRAGSVTESTATVAQLAEEIAKHRALQEVVSGTTAEAGRALRQFRQPVTGEGADAARLNRILKTLYRQNQSDDFLTFMKDVDLDDPVAVANAVRTVYSPSKTDLFSWYLYNSMLSSPVGRVRDFLSTGFNTLTSPLETAVAAPIDAVISTVRRSERGVRLSEMPAEYRGMLAGFGDGWRDAVSVVQHGFTPGQARADLEVASREAVKGPLGGAILNAPTRITAANDVLYRAMNARASLYAQAARTADAEGLKGARWQARYDELRASPTDAMVEQAMTEGRYRVWQQDGALVNWLARGKEQFPALKLIIPFTQTPINLVKYALERSPVGFLSTGVAAARGASQRDVSLGLARASLGSALFYGAYQMAEQGLITGLVPSDPAERDAFYRQGKQPYAIRIGDQWHSYQGLAQAPVIGAAASAVDAFHRGHVETASALATTAVLGLVKTMVDQPFMQGLANIIHAVDDPGRYGSNYLEQFARMPVPQAIQFVGRASDELVRDPQGPGEALLASLPGFSQLVGPKRDYFGARVERPETQRGYASLIPTRPTLAREGRVETELARLQRAEYKVEPGPPSKTVTVKGQPVKLEPAQYDRYRQVGGKLAYAVLSAAMADPGWEALADGRKAKFIDDTIRRAREYAKEQLNAELLPAAYQQYVDQQRRRAAGE